MEVKRWGPDSTIRDVYKKIPIMKCYADDIMSFYRGMLRVIITNPPSQMATSDVDASMRDTIIDYLYERYGRPKWFVDSTVFELLDNLVIDDEDLTGVFIPHDVFSLVFEYGTEMGGVPIRNIRVCRKAAKQTDKFLDELGIGFSGSGSVLNIILDSGNMAMTPDGCQTRPDGGLLSWDTPSGKTSKWNWARALENANMAQSTTLSEREKDIMRRVSRLVVSALLYRSARPDLLEEFSLPRACRYQYRGDRSTYRRMLAPRSSIVKREGVYEFASRTVRGHYRGWVLRTLRHERYKRNADGSFKTVLIEPVAIKGGPDSCPT